MHSHLSGPSGVGTVVLDLGADTGVLILYVPAALDGLEIDVSCGSFRTHSMVRRRDVQATAMYAAVYPLLPAGEYVIWLADGSQVGADVVGGQITSVHIP